MDIPVYVGFSIPVFAIFSVQVPVCVGVSLVDEARRLDPKRWVTPEDGTTLTAISVVWFSVGVTIPQV